MSFGYLGLGLTNEEWASSPWTECKGALEYITGSDLSCAPGWSCNNYLAASQCEYFAGPYKPCTDNGVCDEGWECGSKLYGLQYCIPKAKAVIPSGFNPPGEAPAKIVCPEGSWPNESFTECVQSTGACGDKAVIESVQTILRVHADGIWGPQSAAALKASGQTYQELAPGCTGPVPGGGGSGTGGGKYIPPAPKKLTPPKSAVAGIPNVVWLLVVAGLGAWWYMSKKPATPNRRRRHRRR